MHPENTRRAALITTLVRKLLEKRGFHAAFKAAQQLEAPQELIDELVPLCVERHSFDTAMEQFQEAVLSPAVDTLINQCIHAHRLSDAAQAAELGASEKGLQSLIQECIEQGHAEGLLSALHLLENPLSTEEIDTTVSNCLANDSDLENVLALAKFGASQIVVDALVKAFVKKEDIQQAVKAAKLGASKYVIEGILSQCLTIDAWLNSAVEAAKLGVSSQFLEKLIERLLLQGSYKAVEAATLRSSGFLTPKEIGLLIQNNLNSGQINGAIQAAKHRASPGLRETEIAALITRFTTEGRLNDAIKAAHCRPSGVLTEQEMENFIKMLHISE